MLRLLAKNATVWYAADQASIDGGKLIPFFGVPSMTSTATSRLARVSGATVIPLYFRRLADDTGYLIRFCRPLDNLPTRDEIADTARLTAVLEGFICECPDQYFWTHRRFKSRRGMPDVYEESRP
jgi:KDO2-lipid IV(A) lauroyltransferase